MKWRDDSQDFVKRNLLAEIDAYMAATGMTKTGFGLKSVKDGKILKRLRADHTIRSKNMSAMRRFMAENPPPKDQNSGTEAAA